MKKPIIGVICCLAGIYIMHFGAAAIGILLFVAGVVVMNKR